MIYVNRLITPTTRRVYKAKGYCEKYLEKLVRDNLPKISDAVDNNDELPPYHPHFPLEDEKAIHEAVRRLEYYILDHD
jgi:hypothetical protein